MHLNVASRRRKSYLEFVWARAPRFMVWLLLLNDQKGVCVGDCVDLVPGRVQTLRRDVNLKYTGKQTRSIMRVVRFVF